VLELFAEEFPKIPVPHRNAFRRLIEQFHETVSGLYRRSNTYLNPLTPELNPSAQRCLTRFFTGNFAS
jgi:hypothetical protein